MKDRIENLLNKAAEETRGRVETVVNTTQNQVEKASKLVADGKKPVRRATDMGLTLNDIYYRTARDLLKLQARSVEKNIDALASRLREAAHAGSVRDLLDIPRAAFPAAANRTVNDVRGAFGIVRSAANDVVGVVTSLGEKPKKKAAAKRAPTRAKKAATKKRAASKKAARKTVAQKASTKPATRTKAA
jgi:hypothetical protein